MTGPLDRLGVVELATWIAAPATAAILADWGAEVIKIEPLSGDPFRWIVRVGPDEVNAAFELDNRGKRAIALDVSRPEGREVLHHLLDRADVFLTNLRPATLRGLDLAPDHVLARYPRLVYATVTGYGEVGPEQDRPGYDLGAFWARSGLAAAHTVEGADPPLLRGAVGDHVTAMTLAGGVAAALAARERTGSGRHVSTSLLRAGLYALSQDLNIVARTGTALPMGHSRHTATNPLLNCYRAGDGRWFWLLGLQPDRHWPSVAAAVDRPHWIDDPRFHSLPRRRENAAELIAELDALFAGRSRDEWATIFDRHDVWWEPVHNVHEVLGDPQVHAAGGLIEVPGAHGNIPAVATPVDFSDGAQRARRPPPELGQHTEEVLLELGHDWAGVAVLKEAGVVN